MSRRLPFLPSFVLITAGILGERAALPSLHAVAACAGGAALCVGVLLACELAPALRRARAAPGWRAWGFSALLGLALFFSGVVSSYRFFSLGRPALAVGAAEIEGHITGPVEIVRRGRQRRVAFELEALGAAGMRARVQCFLVNPPAFLRCGDRVSLAGHLQEPPRARNPGEFDYAAFLSAQGIRYVFRGFGRPCLIAAVRRGPPSLAAWFYRLRGELSRRLAKALEPPERDLVAALCLGERRALAPELVAEFVRTGLAHVIAVSGFNVWLLAGGLWGALKLCTVPQRIAVAACLAVVCSYVFLSGAPVTVVRAAWMAGGAFLALLAREPAASLNFLFFASFVILAADPGALGLPSFQLSVASSLALLVLTPRIEAWWAAGRGPARGRRAPLLLRASRAALRRALSSVAVSVAVLIGAGPVMAWHFHALSLTSVAANLVVLPLFVLAMWCAVPGILSLAVWPPAAWPFLGSARALLAAALAVNGILARLPGFIHLSRGGWVWLAAACALLAACAVGRRKMARLGLWGPRPALLTAAGVAVLGVLVFTGAAREQPFSLTVLAARDGFLALAHLPVHGPVLLNTGGGRDGRGVFWLTLPYLRSQGIQRVSSVIVHSLTAGESGGLEALSRQMGVGGVFVSVKDVKRAAAVGGRFTGGVTVYRVGEPLRLGTGRTAIERASAGTWIFYGKAVKIALVLSDGASGRVGLRKRGACFDAVVFGGGAAGWGRFARRCPNTVVVAAVSEGLSKSLGGSGLHAYATSACGSVSLVEAPGGRLRVGTFLKCV